MDIPFLIIAIGICVFCVLAGLALLLFAGAAYADVQISLSEIKPAKTDDE